MHDILINLGYDSFWPEKVRRFLLAGYMSAVEATSKCSSVLSTLENSRTKQVLNLLASRFHLSAYRN
jgi:hypothetical protein